MRVHLVKYIPNLCYGPVYLGFADHERGCQPNDRVVRFFAKKSALHECLAYITCTGIVRIDLDTNEKALAPYIAY